MDESILKTIKKLVGVDDSYDVFDKDLIVYINDVFMTLHQLGVGPSTIFSITGENEKWSDFSELDNINSVKNYIYLNVRLMFDPPTSSILVDIIKKKIDELEFRFLVYDSSIVE